MPDNTNAPIMDSTTNEPDQDAPGLYDEKPQESEHPNITRPAKTPMTNESLSLLGAGQPYNPRYT